MPLSISYSLCTPRCNYSTCTQPFRYVVAHRANNTNNVKNVTSLASWLTLQSEAVNQSAYQLTPRKYAREEGNTFSLLKYFFCHSPVHGANSITRSRVRQITSLHVFPSLETNLTIFHHVRPTPLTISGSIDPTAAYSFSATYWLTLPAERKSSDKSMRSHLSSEFDRQKQKHYTYAPRPAHASHVLLQYRSRNRQRLCSYLLAHSADKTDEVRNRRVLPRPLVISRSVVSTAAGGSSTTYLLTAQTEQTSSEKLVRSHPRSTLFGQKNLYEY